ncbi:hypothetical protein [Microbulbifer elongatus]|uniref:hypothetical protein n=1 Tax=Microbulbifer elongatus TaxID=86173 RepID=UPI001E5B3BCF|nr:hypothetical protein [Microbulbifer elongatus]
MSRILVNIIVPALSAILGFSGALAGALIPSWTSEKIFERQVKVERERILFTKKIELLERVSKLANLTSKYEGYQHYLNLQADLASDLKICKASGIADCVEPDGTKSALAVSEKRSDLNADFSSTMQLINIYFGKNVSAEVNNLSARKVWWDNDGNNFRDLIIAMRDEIHGKT